LRVGKSFQQENTPLQKMLREMVEIPQKSLAISGSTLETTDLLHVSASVHAPAIIG
jgi:hypothetical protein